MLRCNWSEVSAITGVDVTPVVGFIGNLDDANVQINADEVQEFFTVPLSELLNRRKWVRRSYSAPVFTGADNVIWGLTAYVDKEEQRREEKRYSSTLYATCCVVYAVCNVQCVQCVRCDGVCVVWYVLCILLKRCNTNVVTLLFPPCRQVHFGSIHHRDLFPDHDDKHPLCTPRAEC